MEEVKLSPEEMAKKFKTLYSSYAHDKEEVKEINAATTATIASSAKELNVKPELLRKTLDYLYKKRETGVDDIELMQNFLANLSNDEDSPE
jgi:hypothetical protein